MRSPEAKLLNWLEQAANIDTNMERGAYVTPTKQGRVSQARAFLAHRIAEVAYPLAFQQALMSGDPQRLVRVVGRFPTPDTLVSMFRRDPESFREVLSPPQPPESFWELT